MRWIDQMIGDYAAAARFSAMPAKIVGSLARKLRTLRLRYGDPLVDFKWCGETIQLPLSHDLPLFVNSFPQYNRTLGRLAATLTRCLGRPIVAMDVGANIGDTAILLLQNGARSVICVEGDPRYAELLRRNTSHLHQVIIVECLVAFADAPKNLRISKARGTGFVIESEEAAAVPVMTLDEIITAHRRDPAKIDLVKIDTDGYDGAIIRRHEPFFSDVKPVIHFEYLFSAAGGMSSAKNLPDEEALAALAAAGYDRFIAYRNTGSPVIYAAVSKAASLLRRLYATGALGVYADVAAFPDSACEVAEQAALDLGLEYTAA